MLHIDEGCRHHEFIHAILDQGLVDVLLDEGGLAAVVEATQQNLAGFEIGLLHFLN